MDRVNMWELVGRCSCSAEALARDFNVWNKGEVGIFLLYN